jgi:hypothetical protein
VTIERVLTDDALAYRHSLREVCADLGIKQKVIKPACISSRSSVVARG